MDDVARKKLEAMACDIRSACFGISSALSNGRVSIPFGAAVEIVPALDRLMDLSWELAGCAKAEEPKP